MPDWEFMKRIDAEMRETEKIYRLAETSGAFHEAQLAASQMEKMYRASLIGEEFYRSLSSGVLPNVDAASAIAAKLQLMSTSFAPDDSMISALKNLGSFSEALASKDFAEAIKKNSIDPSWYTAAEEVSRGVLTLDDRASEVYKALTHDYGAAALSAFDRKLLGELVHPPALPEWDGLRAGLDKMVLAQETLGAALAAREFGRLEVPRIVTEWPLWGVLSHAELLRAIAGEVPLGVPAEEARQWEERREELSEEIEALLLEALEDFPAMRAEWLSAKAQRRSQRGLNWRYFSVSIRQLLDRGLHLAAPQSSPAYVEWCRANGMADSERRSRFRYVAATYQYPGFPECVELDSEQIFWVWKLVVEGAHGDQPLSDEALRVAEFRAAVWLIGVLTLSKARQGR